MKIFLSISLFLCSTTYLYAADLFNGELQHSEKCTGCHDSSIYSREDRKVSSKPRLVAQVNFCKNNLGLMWFDEEVSDVVEYLNKHYYKF